jgi:predicted DNA-binding transcriptional regulator AlpA
MDDDGIVDWKALKALGWPYSRAQTWRLMDAGKFPKSFKLVENCRNSHPVWWRREVVARLKAASANK